MKASSWNVADDLLHRMQDEPDHIAIKTANGNSITNSELIAKVYGLSVGLRDRGLRSGDRMLIQVPNGELFISSALASLFLGAVPIFADPRSGALPYEHSLGQALPNWNIVHPAVILANRIPLVGRFINRNALVIPQIPKYVENQFWLNGVRLWKLESRKEWPDSVQGTGLDASAIVFTGGSTGMPKGLIFTHDAIRAYFNQVKGMTADLPKMHALLAHTPQQGMIAMWLGITAVVSGGRGGNLPQNIVKLIRRSDIY